MSTQTLEVQAQTLQVARQDLQKKLTTGTVVIQETVLTDGSSKEVEAAGTTIDDAVQKAKAKLPANTTIEKQAVLKQPTRDTIQVRAFEESEARQKAAVARPKRIESVSMIESGRKGFLGIGRRPNTYDIRVTQPAFVRLTYHEPARIRAEVGTLLDKYSQQLSGLSDAECAAIIRGNSAEETAAILEALKSYSGKVQLQALLAGIDHLATGPESSRQLAIRFLVAKDSMPRTAWKIAYELRERALQEDEITMPLSQFVDEFRKTPAWGKARAQSALEFVRKFFEQSPQGRDQFEEQYTYFSRSGPLVTEAEALGKLGDERAVKPLSEAYKDDHDADVLVKALTSIGTLEAKQEAQRIQEVKRVKAGRIVVRANAAAVEIMCRLVDSNLAEVATLLFARQYGRSEHLNASGGLSESGYQAISGHYIWETTGGGLVITRGQDCPEPAATMIGPMSALPECYVGGLFSKFRG